MAIVTLTQAQNAAALVLDTSEVVAYGETAPGQSPLNIYTRGGFMFVVAGTLDGVMDIIREAEAEDDSIEDTRRGGTV